MAGFVINHVTISGTLTRDPEVRTIPSGAVVCSLRIASNDRVKDGDQWTDKPGFYNITIWKGVGEYVGRTLHKGDDIAVSGRLRWREWEKDGNKREAVDIVAYDVMPRQRSSDGTSSSSSSSPVRTSETDIPVDTADISPTAYGDPEDDVPFKWEPAEWDDRYHPNR
jgi:single-strand DNA-binding protein